MLGAAGSSPAAGVACLGSRSGALWGCTTVARNAEYRSKPESSISLFALVSTARMRASECIGCFDACQQRVSSQRTLSDSGQRLVQPVLRSHSQLSAMHSMCSIVSVPAFPASSASLRYVVISQRVVSLDLTRYRNQSPWCNTALIIHLLIAL